MQLTASELALLEPYRRALPPQEYAALTAWFSTFWPFQRPWILDRSRRAFVNKSRQIGISHSTAGLLNLWGAFHGETTTIISVGEREAAEVLDKCKKHRDVLVRLGSQMAKRGGRDNATEITFASGGRVVSLPSTGGRGFTGNAYLDEFAYYEHPEKVWDAALAVTTLGFRARISSTPNGVGNLFHQLVSMPEVNRGWQGYDIPMQTAIADGYPVSLEDCWSIAKGDPRIFDQLFNCKFLDGELQYIPTDLVNACSFDNLGTGEGDYFAGLDIGKTADKTVLTVVRLTGGQRVVQYIETHRRTDSDGLEKMVADAFKAFGIKRMAVDATGMGSFPAERMRKRHGYWKIEPFVFTQKSKEDLATALYTAFAERSVMLPKTDAALPKKPAALPGWLPKAADQLREDICAIRREITTAGNVRYDAPHTDKGHADSAWSLALALHAAGQAPARGHLSADVAAAL